MNKKCVKRRKEAAWKATKDVRYILSVLDKAIEEVPPYVPERDC